ncbi:MAG: PEGA domain-containing protein [bacterium]
MRALFTISFLNVLVCSLVIGQQKYGEISVSVPEELTTVVRSEDRSVLSIVSEVPALQFESTRQLFETRQISENEWQLFVEPGRQIITIRASGYLPVKTGVINLKAKRAYRLKVSQVRPVPGTLFIKTTPDSASLRINGVPVDAKTPYRTDEAPPGNYYVQILKEGYRSEEKTLTVESNKVSELEIELTQTALRVQIDIENNLQEVGILIDEEAVGMAPGAIYLEPGSYRLMLQKPGYKYTEKVIDIELGPEEIHLVEKLEVIKKPFYSKWWFLTSSAAAIAGGTFFFIDSRGKAEPLPEPPEFP